MRPGGSARGYWNGYGGRWSTSATAPALLPLDETEVAGGKSGSCSAATGSRSGDSTELRDSDDPGRSKWPDISRSARVLLCRSSIATIAASASSSGALLHNPPESAGIE